MSSSHCCFLTCIPIFQEAGQVVWYSYLLKNFTQFVVIYTIQDFGVVNKAKVEVFLALSCFFNDPANVDNLISVSSAFSKSSLNIWKFTGHTPLKPDLENFEHYFAIVWDECFSSSRLIWQVYDVCGKHPFSLDPLPSQHILLPCGLKWCSGLSQREGEEGRVKEVSFLCRWTAQIFDTLITPM